MRKFGLYEEFEEPCISSTLALSNCSNLDASLDKENTHILRSLESLHISGCDKLNSSLSSIQIFTTLGLWKIFCVRPGSWPKDLYHLANLRALELCGFSDELDCFPWPYSISNVASAVKHAGSTKQQHHFVSLQELAWPGCPRIMSLPEQIQHVSTLRRLTNREVRWI